MLRPYRGTAPRVHPTAFIDDSAQVIGDVEIGEESSVWMCAIVRGDVNRIRIGAILLNGGRIGSGSIVAAGTLITANMQVPRSRKS